MQTHPPHHGEPKRCRLCGEVRPLTFEHIPPRSAYNRSRATIGGIESWIARDQNPLAPAGKRSIQQRGSGSYALCEPCNNLAGRLYVPEFTRWTRMGADILFGPKGCGQRFRNEEQTAYAQVQMKSCRPARFVKQMVTMLLAMSQPALGDLHPDLRSFARDPDSTGLPSELQLYLALYAGPVVRYVSGAGALRNIGTDKPVEQHLIFELAYPPFSYILSVDERTPAIETGNISSFANAKIHERANVQLQLIVGYGETPFPIDLRSPAAIRAQAAQTGAA